jgi:hypothetical protein
VPDRHTEVNELVFVNFVAITLNKNKQRKRQEEEKRRDIKTTGKKVKKRGT